MDEIKEIRSPTLLKTGVCPFTRWNNPPTTLATLPVTSVSVAKLQNRLKDLMVTLLDHLLL